MKHDAVSVVSSALALAAITGPALAVDTPPVPMPGFGVSGIVAAAVIAAVAIYRIKRKK